ncbi:MAG TPA: hypothetical protein VME21_02035 [Steroidobacteraceae bacterium]|nr:hypothetical protein [Steroidobacteraceae bacterium]
MQPVFLRTTLLALWVASALAPASAAPALGGRVSSATSSGTCDKACLESIGERYRDAYVHHDPRRVPIAAHVRFTENNVEMAFPDGTWDSVTREPGPALVISDPQTGNVGIYTVILQNDTPGYLAVRLKVVNGEITEIEHMVSTRRNLSSPPTPFGDWQHFVHDPRLARTVPPANRVPRRELISLANGYFSTLQNNTGEIRGTRFAPDAIRQENGLKFTDIEKAFRRGVYRFNARVRDRDYFLVDEQRGLVMSRAFIDHKGILDAYTLTDGTPAHSPFHEPQSWSLLELFKIENGMITSVETTFSAAPYYMRSPWTLHPDPR